LTILHIYAIIVSVIKDFKVLKLGLAERNIASLNSFIPKAILSLALMAAGGALYFNIHQPAEVSAQAPGPIQPAVIYSVSSKTVAETVAAPAAPAIKPLPALQCSPDTGYQPAGPIALSGRPGLIEIDDNLYAHKMYGYSAGQLRGLSIQCPLVLAGSNENDVNAATSYWLGWQFNYANGGDGLCTVSDASVTLHTSQALPAWQNASPGLTAAWQKYQAAVTIHEAGHLQLDRDYADKILGKIQSFQPQDCSTIEQSVNSMASGLVASLDQANINYDISTQYGAAQGTIVP
jgi:predicted secreted Zn-dependent protease